MAVLFRERDVYFTCADSALEDFKYIVRAYNEAHNAVAKMEEEQIAQEKEQVVPKKKETIQEKKRIAQGKKQVVEKKTELRMLWRKLILITDVPFLTDTLTDIPDYLMHRSIYKSYPWDDPESHTLWNNYKELLYSSPKLRYIVKAARAMKEKPSAIEFRDEQGVKFKHYDKIVFAAYDPLFAFCIYVVLLQELSTRYEGGKGAKGAIQPLWNDGHALDIASEFQRTPEECNRIGEHSIDIIVLLTRVNTTGVTLTKANRLIMADVDPSGARDAQLQMLIQGITQVWPATFVQLLSDSLDIQETMLHNRELGKPTMGNVIPLPGDDEFEVSGDESGADVTVDMEDEASPDEWDSDDE